MSTITLIVCGKCGITAPIETPGWLYAPNKDNPDALVIRCPKHNTDYAKTKAGMKGTYHKEHGYASQKKHAKKARK